MEAVENKETLATMEEAFGPLKCTYYREETHKRGSLHAHCLSFPAVVEKENCFVRAWKYMESFFHTWRSS